MDLILLLGIAVALLVILVTLFFFTKGKGSQESGKYSLLFVTNKYDK